MNSIVSVTRFVYRSMITKCHFDQYVELAIKGLMIIESIPQTFKLLENSFE